jgi:hypothetical protein
LAGIFTLNELDEKIEEILSVDEEGLVFEDLQMAMGTVIEEDSHNLKKKTDGDTENKNVTDDVFEFGFFVQNDFTPL